MKHEFLAIVFISIFLVKVYRIPRITTANKFNVHTFQQLLNKMNSSSIRNHKHRVHQGHHHNHGLRNRRFEINSNKMKNPNSSVKDTKTSNEFGLDLLETMLISKWEADLKSGLVRVIPNMPQEKAISGFLNRGVIGRFLYTHTKFGPISITVTPCSSLILWNIQLWSSGSGQDPTSNPNSKNKVSPTPTIQFLDSFRTERSILYHEPFSMPGIFILEIRSIYSDSYVHLYISTESDSESSSIYPNIDYLNQSGKSYSNTKSYTYNYFPTFPSLNYYKPWIRFKKLSGERLQIKWDTSLINPAYSHYCLIINSKKDYSSICGALGDKYGILPPDLRFLPIYTNKLSTLDSSPNSTNMQNDDIFLIGCLQRRKHYVLTDLENGKMYYFNVFLKDIRTNLTYPYVKGSYLYKLTKKSPEMNILNDLKPMKIIFTPENTSSHIMFNLKKACNDLTISFNLCYTTFPNSNNNNTAIIVRIFHLLSNYTIYQSRLRSNYEMVQVAYPITGKYLVEINLEYVQKIGESENGVHRNYTTMNLNPTPKIMLEVLLSKKNKRFPYPSLPEKTALSHEDKLTTCDSVTISWWTGGTGDKHKISYCIFLKSSRSNNRLSLPSFKPPYQCSVEKYLINDPYVVHNECINQRRAHNNGKSQLLNHTISGLSPSTGYIVQLIIRKGMSKQNQGKALSYDYHYVRTKEKCIENY